MSYPHATAPAEAAALLSSGSGVLIDVRTPAEFREVHTEHAHSLPLADLQGRTVEELSRSNPGPVFLLCASGIRATKAAEQLRNAGIARISVIEGGIHAWEAAGLPVRRGRKTISIERQVRIGAGTLVLTGVIVGKTWQPGFLGLSAFVGAGLVFAGVSDICALAILLAKAPWNRT